MQITKMRRRWKIINDAEVNSSIILVIKSAVH